MRQIDKKLYERCQRRYICAKNIDTLDVLGKVPVSYQRLAIDLFVD